MDIADKPTDPSTQSSIGGNQATNANGHHCDEDDSAASDLLDSTPAKERVGSAAPDGEVLGGKVEENGRSKVDGHRGEVRGQCGTDEDHQRICGPVPGRTSLHDYELSGMPGRSQTSHCSEGNTESEDEANHVPGSASSEVLLENHNEEVEGSKPDISEAESASKDHDLNASTSGHRRSILDYARDPNRARKLIVSDAELYPENGKMVICPSFLDRDSSDRAVRALLEVSMPLANEVFDKEPESSNVASSDYVERTSEPFTIDAREDEIFQVRGRISAPFPASENEGDAEASIPGGELDIKYMLETVPRAQYPK